MYTTRATHRHDFKLLAQQLQCADEASWKIFVFLAKLLLELCESMQCALALSTARSDNFHFFLVEGRY
jgi:hypothetical protein